MYSFVLVVEFWLVVVVAGGGGVVWYMGLFLLLWIARVNGCMCFITILCVL